MTIVRPSKLRRFLKGKDGATAIEYAIVAAILAVAVIAALNGIRDELNETFESVSADLAENNTVQ